MSQELTVIQQAAIPDATKKATGWQAFGYNAALTEVQLNHEAATAIAATPLPTSIELIAEYELVLAGLKRGQQEISVQRQKITAVTDAWKERQMTAEKSVKAHIEAYGAALLPLKQQAQAEANAKQARINALASFKTMALQEYNELQSKCQQLINDRVADLYIRAIESPTCTSIEPAVMDKMKLALQAKDFMLPEMKDSDPEKLAIITEIFGAHNPDSYVDMYHKLLTLKFSSFANDKKFSAESVAQATYEKQTTAQDIADEKNMQNISATMQGHAVERVELAHKSLKEVYVLDMDDTAATGLAIMSAFITLKGWDKLRTKSVFNVKISQMADVLARLKSEDNDLTITGITFKKEDRL